MGSTPFVTPQGTLQVGPTHRISSFPLSSFRLPRDSNPGPRVFSPMGSIFSPKGFFCSPFHGSSLFLSFFFVFFSFCFLFFGFPLPILSTLLRNVLSTHVGVWGHNVPTIFFFISSFFVIFLYIFFISFNVFFCYF